MKEIAQINARFQEVNFKKVTLKTIRLDLYSILQLCILYIIKPLIRSRHMMLNKSVLID